MSQCRYYLITIVHRLLHICKILITWPNKVQIGLWLAVVRFVCTYALPHSVHLVELFSSGHLNQIFIGLDYFYNQSFVKLSQKYSVLFKQI